MLMDNCPKNDGQTPPCVANVRAPRENSHIPVHRPLITRAYTAVPEKKGAGLQSAPLRAETVRTKLGILVLEVFEKQLQIAF